MQHIRRSEQGQAVVEFVLVFSILLVILFAILEIGSMLNSRLILSAAAREGARRAAVEGGSHDSVYSRIEQQLRFGNISPEDVEIQITPNRASYGSPIEVRLVYRYSWKSAFLQSIYRKDVILEVAVITRSEKVRW